MNSNTYCFDTHVLIWYFTGQKTLSTKAKLLTDRIINGEISCLTASIVLLEAFHAGLRYRKFDFPTCLSALRIPTVRIVPLDQDILFQCYQLPKNLNIHDRIIAATALATQSTLITKDPELRSLKTIKTIW